MERRVQLLTYERLEKGCNFLEMNEILFAITKNILTV